MLTHSIAPIRSVIPSQTLLSSLASDTLKWTNAMCDSVKALAYY